MSKMDSRENNGLLVLRHSDEKREIEFELNFLSSLNLSQRFLLMETKSREQKSNLIKNGHRETPQIIKRK
jgi:hypothetical protein